MKDYINEISRREVQITRFASFLLKEYGYTSLVDAYESARAILLSAESVTSVTKLKAVEREILKEIKKPFTDVLMSIEQEMQKFAAEEAAYNADLFSGAAGVTVKLPDNEAIIAAATKNYMTLETASQAVSAPFNKFATANAASVMDSIVSQIAAGYSKRETVPELIARVKAVTSGMLKNHIETLVRTGVSFYAQQARNAVRDENLDIIEREIPVVTFDNRTSLICMSISERYPKGWKVGQSPIGYPPYHYGCRTVIIFWTGGDFEFEGTRASVGGSHSKEAYEAAEDGKIAFNKRKDKEYFDPKPIPAKTPFTNWLKSQPYWYIKQQLGAKRAELFINGDLQLARLTDKDLKPLTLEQLEKRG